MNLTDLVPPHSVEAEQGVLGGLLLDNSTWDLIADTVSAQDFFKREHRLIFQAIQTLAAANQGFDVVTVADSMAEEPEAGGLGYLSELAKNTPSVANISVYAAIVRERSHLRQLILLGHECSRNATDAQAKSVEVQEEFEQKLFALGQPTRIRLGSSQWQEDSMIPVESPISHARHFALSSQANCRKVEKGMITQPDFQVLELMAGIPGQPMDLLIRSGVSLEAIDNLSQHGVNAVNVGIINARTLRHRRTKGERLSPEEGDRLYRVSKLVVLAEQVFGDKDKAAHWLNKAQKAFAGLTALEAAGTTPGYAAAEETLERINHGFFA